MKRILIVAAFVSGCAGVSGNESVSSVTETAVLAKQLAKDFLIVDTHIDVPYRLNEKWEDVSMATEEGDFDHPRAVEGGLNAAFMSVYIPARKQDVPGAAVAFADSMIDLVESIVMNAPEKFAVATSADEVRTYASEGIVALPMGMENGAPIEDMEKLRHFFDRGIRYITLTHGSVNHISDSSYDTTRTWNGLSPFGEELVVEMNRLGVIVDISHVTDSAFYDVMRIAKAPAIASHSSARHFTPGFERNMSDDLIVALAANGGVIQINFGSSFLIESANKSDSANQAAVSLYLEENGISADSDEGVAYSDAYMEAHPEPFADVSDVANHIDHVVELVGIDHVGIGSDYDGVGDSLPTGLKDVSQYPNLVAELLERGYAKGDIEKILGANMLRVWEQVEAVATHLQADTN